MLQRPQREPRDSSRIDKLKLNDRFVKSSAAGEYLVQLPALSTAQPVPLLKYTTTPKWRPVPLFVEASLSAADGAERRVRLRAKIEANPQLKTPLQNVALYGLSSSADLRAS